MFTCPLQSQPWRPTLSSKLVFIQYIRVRIHEFYNYAPSEYIVRKFTRVQLYRTKMWYRRNDRTTMDYRHVVTDRLLDCCILDRPVGLLKRYTEPCVVANVRQQKEEKHVDISKHPNQARMVTVDLISTVACQQPQAGHVRSYLHQRCADGGRKKSRDPQTDADGSPPKICGRRSLA